MEKPATKFARIFSTFVCLPPSDLMRQSVEEGGCASGSRTCWRKIVNI